MLISGCVFNTECDFAAVTPPSLAMTGLTTADPGGRHKWREPLATRQNTRGSKSSANSHLVISPLDSLRRLANPCGEVLCGLDKALYHYETSAFAKQFETNVNRTKITKIHFANWIHFFKGKTRVPKRVLQKQHKNTLVWRP